MIREAKWLLGSLPVRTPSAYLEREIKRQTLLDQSRFLPLMSPSSWSPPPRGRRLATALALSCLGIFVVAAPFGSGTVDLMASRPISFSSLGHYEQKHDLLDTRFMFSLQPLSYDSQRSVTPVSWKAGPQRHNARGQAPDLLSSTEPGGWSAPMQSTFNNDMTSFAAFNH